MTSESLEDLVQKWLLWDKDQTTAAEIRSLRHAESQTGSSWVGSQGELEKRLRNRIQFGTAGLRGRMQAGFAFMNCLTVIQASQGIAQYLVSSATGSPASVIIGHDTRHNSARFARLAANAFISKGIKVHLFEDYVPTPFVAFGVRMMKAAAGIMITASHNPAQDNGYKVYQSNGAQINTPVDEYISRSISENLEPWEGAWEESNILQEPPKLLPTLREQYCQLLLSRYPLNESNERGEKLTVGPVYTAMHGVGWTIAAEVALRINRRTLTPVSEQIHPHPDFPTVKFPNPEEDGALTLAYATADNAGQNIVIANDPDADRFAAAQKIDGCWRRFTGDQAGVLFADYLLENELQNNEQRNVVMLCSAVSSGMLKKMVQAAGSRFHFEETLTGFKWIGNRAEQLQNDGFVPLFGYEEALGYMFPEVSWDKDGIAAMSTFLCALSHWEKQGLDPWSKLLQLYEKHGYHESINTYFISPSPVYTKEVFARIRESKEISEMSLGEYEIVRWRDITRGTEHGAWENKLPLDMTSEMLQFQVVEGDAANAAKESADENFEAKPIEISFTIRASGTEPKIKLYLECSGSTEDKAQHHAATVFSAVVKEWITPFGKDLRHSGSARSSSGQESTVTMG